jgi:hypothetical protein
MWTTGAKYPSIAIWDVHSIAGDKETRQRIYGQQTQQGCG